VRKYVISLLFLLIASTAFCQKKSKVNLISSTKSEGVKRNGVDMIKVYNGVWKQDFSIMRSDSAYFHPAANAFEAFGHVNINQGDTLNIYSDKLNYDGNTKIAILTDNVVMVDKETTLTTNYFTYSTATRIGTYTDGGKIVNKTNTLTSKNGYYFAGTHDAYFRYDVVCVTSDARIITDTMRYNSKTRINYFYGPTHIYGTKDKDTLDTDLGTYDTNTEQANFVKNNLYRQGTKSLKGDTLFYDRIKGFGRAVKHVIFNDNEQKVAIRGGLGTYFKANDLTIVTRDPYVVLVAEDKDTTKSDGVKKIPVLSKKDSLARIAAGKVKKGNVGNKKQAIQNLTMPTINNLTVQTKMIDSASKRLKMPVLDSFSKKLPETVNLDSVNKRLFAQSKKIDKATQNKLRAAAAKGISKAKIDTNEILSKAPATPKDTSHIKRDSVYMSADTIETRILTFKELSKLQELERLSHIRDTTKKVIVPSIIYKKPLQSLSLDPPKWPRDTSYYHHDYFGPPKPKYQKPKKKVVTSAPKKNVKADSTFYTKKVVLSDTARVRIIMAFHKGKIFKSDLQAVADSIFYSNSDSTIRCYTKPMVWTEGSQLSGDTIYLQLRNKKLDKMDMFPNAFIVNVEKKDSVHFNQVGGKKMRGFFKDSKLSRVYVDGNAETIYFVHDSTTNLVTEMQRSSSSRIWVYMKNNEVTRLGFVTKPENRYIPIKMVKDDEKILKGFLWKPKDRPVSKESVLPSYNKKPDTTKTHLAGLPRPKKMFGKNGKDTSVNKKTSIKAAGDSTLKKSPGIKAGSDTTKNNLLKTSPAIKTRQDSLLKNSNVKPAGKDTSAIKQPPLLSPAIKAKQDSTIKQP